MLNRNMYMNDHLLFFIMLGMIIFILVLLFAFLAIVRYPHNKKMENTKMQGTTRSDFEIKSLEERLRTAQKMISICLISKSPNEKIIRQYGQIIERDIYGYYLNSENIIQTIDLLYNNFTEKIETTFPDLTQKEILLCALIKANFRTNEIAALLSYQEDSIRTMKVRLRSKMNFKSQNDFLLYLNNI